jgi:uncharacterized metal-binding protein YceD (DUF177 family)
MNPVALDRLGPQPQRFVVELDADARRAVAERLHLYDLEELRGDLELRRTADGAEARGRVTGRAVQACVVSGEPVIAEVDEEIALRFAELGEITPDAEIELGEDELDVVPLDGPAVDLEAAVADTLALALDPFPKADDATLREARARLLSEEEAAAQAVAARNPFTALKQ